MLCTRPRCGTVLLAENYSVPAVAGTCCCTARQESNLRSDGHWKKWEDSSLTSRLTVAACRCGGAAHDDDGCHLGGRIGHTVAVGRCGQAQGAGPGSGTALPGLPARPTRGCRIH